MSVSDPLALSLQVFALLLSHFTRVIPFLVFYFVHKSTPVEAPFPVSIAFRTESLNQDLGMIASKRPAQDCLDSIPLKVAGAYRFSLSDAFSRATSADEMPFDQEKKIGSPGRESNPGSSSIRASFPNSSGKRSKQGTLS
ncbi:hypothetical protein V6N11_014204 [Hibiscus sabdariffa]|uniref:Uncharacterized protein n=1 Tax=Hibiscus sabdariffa TaxID=183260 RepID=A0ABR2AGJ0_9ROSI